MDIEKPIEIDSILYKEEWRDISSLNNNHQVSNFGRVRRSRFYMSNGNVKNRKPKLVKLSNRKEYPTVRLIIDGKLMSLSVRGLMYEVFGNNSDLILPKYRNIKEIITNISREINGIIYHEEWKLVPGWGDRYMISSFGRLKCISPASNSKSIHQKEYLPKTFLAKCYTAKYIKVSLSHKGKHFTAATHRLVAEVFVPNPDNKPFVNHKDLNNMNNHYTNLEWVTSRENTLHYYKTKNEIFNYQEFKKSLGKEKDMDFVWNSIGIPFK